jgi:Ca2+-binding EF-hand superfamily protein
LSAEEVEDIKEMFKAMDTDNDGIVSCEELKSGIAKFGSHLAESEVQMLIEAVSIAKNLTFILYSLFKNMRQDMCLPRRSIGV